jgi:glutamate synthase domain-containing protein 3
VLGETGRNFAAGMSGGVAYVFDEHGRFATHVNRSMVEVEALVSHDEQQAQGEAEGWHLGQTDEMLLRDLIEKQFRYTGSFRAKAILEDWSRMRGKFVKVISNEYRRALKNMATEQAAAKAAADATQPLAA